MSNTKSAVLFYGKDKTPIPFDKYTFYNVGTGYIALYESNGCGELCRLLDERELLDFGKNAQILVFKSNGNLYERYVIVLKMLKSISEADELIKNISLNSYLQ